MLRCQNQENGLRNGQKKKDGNRCVDKDGRTVGTAVIPIQSMVPGGIQQYSICLATQRRLCRQTPSKLKYRRKRKDVKIISDQKRVCVCASVCACMCVHIYVYIYVLNVF